MLKELFDKINAKLESFGELKYPTIGFEIGTSSANCVMLGGTRSKPSCKKAATSSQLESAQKLLAVGTAEVAVAVPSNAVVSKKIPIPGSIKKDNFEQFARAEARKAFPGLTNDLMLDYNIDQNNMILYAARKKEIDNCMGILTEYNLTTTLIDIDYFCLARAYPLISSQLKHAKASDCVGILNFEPDALLFVVMKNNEIIFFHRQSFNDATLNAIIEQHLNGGKIEPLSGTHVEMLSSNTNRLRQYFQTEHLSEQLSEIALSGRCALIPDLGPALSKALETPVTVVNPFPKKPIGPAMMICTGLALRGLR